MVGRSAGRGEWGRRGGTTLGVVSQGWSDATLGNTAVAGRLIIPGLSKSGEKCPQ